MQDTKVTVSGRALLARINRKLAHDGKALRKSHGAGELAMGAYFVVDRKRNQVTRKHVDVVKLAHELDILQPWEEAK